MPESGVGAQILVGLRQAGYEPLSQPTTQGPWPGIPAIFAYAMNVDGTTAPLVQGENR